MGNGNIAVRQWLSDKERFADLFNGIVFGGEQVIRPEELEKSDSESSIIVPDKEKKERGVRRHRDIVMRWRKETELVILACENQQKVHYAMPVRTMLYDSLAYVEQVKELWGDKSKEERKELDGEEYLSHFGKEDRIFPVVTLVLYYGADEWNNNKNLYEMFRLEENEKTKKLLEKYIPNYHINLIDMKHMENPERFKMDLQAIFNMLKYEKQKSKLLNYVKEHEEYFSKVDSETYMAFREFLHSEKLMKKIIPEKSGRESVNMCEALEELYADGIAEGERKGRTEGEKRGEDFFAALTEKLIKASRMDELLRATTDKAFREILYREYRIKE